MVPDKCDGNLERYLSMNNTMILNSFIKKKRKKIQLLLLRKFVTVDEIIIWVKTFKKYGLNNIHIWSTVWVSNSGKVDYSFLVAKFVKHCYFQAMFPQI